MTYMMLPTPGRARLQSKPPARLTRRSGTRPVRVLKVRRQGVAIGRGTVFIPAGSNLSGLGFSLKPPKWLRKMQPGKILKKAALPLAIGAALFIPGALPLLAKGVVGASKLVVGGGRLVAKGVTAAARLAAGNAKTAAGVFRPAGGTTAVDISPQPDVSQVYYEETPTNAQITIQTPSTTQAANAQAPGPSESYLPGYEAPQAAGMAGGLAPLVIGGAALLAIAAANRKARR